jgi:competence protein ComEA
MRLSAQISLTLAVLALACNFSDRGFVSPVQAQAHATRTPLAADPTDINTATLEQLMKVPGLTRTWAARIIRSRPYRGKNELLDRGIVSAEVYARIKDHIIAHRPRN